MKEYIARNLYIYPPRALDAAHHGHLRVLRRRDPQLQHHLHLGVPHPRGGSTAAQEVAFTLGDRIEYVQAAIDAGLDVDEFAPQLSFFFNAHNNIFEEAAKFRAARRMWATIMEERFDAQNRNRNSSSSTPRPAARRSLPSRSRTTSSGCRIKHSRRYSAGPRASTPAGKDEALALPTEQSVRTALRTQQILAHESGAADTIDPLAGSYYVENLTDGIEEDAFEILEEVDRRGGMLEAVKSQWVQRQIQDVAFERQREIEDGERVIVGVNKFEVDEAGDGPRRGRPRTGSRISASASKR